MEIIFLGTSAGTPTKTRNVMGIAVKRVISKLWYLVDCGEGTQHQILRTNLSLMNLQAIFISHVHGDHCYGLPGILASANMLGRTSPLIIVAPTAIKEFIKGVQNTTQLWLSFEIKFIEIEAISEGVDVNEFSIEIAELSHRVPSFAFCFIEKNINRKLNIEKLYKDGVSRGPVWGRLQAGHDVQLSNGGILISKDYLLQERSPRKIIVSGDNDNPSLLAECSKHANVLIHEATYTEEVAQKIGKEPQHSTAKDIAQFAESASIENLVLTHFSPRYQEINGEGNTIADIESEAKKFYSGNLFLAKDFDLLRLNCDGSLDKLTTEI